MDFNDNKPIYIQLAEQLMDEVGMESAGAGDRLPSVRDYAAKVGVNVNTVMRTYAMLQQEEIIYNQRGIGYFYADDARSKVIKIRKKEFLEKELPYFFDRLYKIGIDPAKLEQAFENYIKTRKAEL